MSNPSGKPPLQRGIEMTERQMIWTIIGMWALVGISLLCHRMGWA